MPPSTFMLFQECVYDFEITIEEYSFAHIDGRIKQPFKTLTWKEEFSSTMEFPVLVVKQTR